MGAVGTIGVSQAISAFILARTYLNALGYRISMKPDLDDVIVDGQLITLLKILIETQSC